MKHLFNTIMISVVAGLGLVSCDIDKQFDTKIPQYPLTQLVKSATATVGDETVAGVVDNDAHTITFVFKETKDFSSVSVKMSYPSRVIRKDGALDELTADLSASKAYTFVVNNLEEDVTYSMTAFRAATIKVDRTQCSVVTGLEGDANPVKMSTTTNPEGKYGSLPKHLFDGIYMTAKPTYDDDNHQWSSIGYRSFGWAMDTGDMTGANGEKYGNAYTVDLGAKMRVAKMVFWPYLPYTREEGAQFEIYAWTLDGEPSGDWGNWQLIASADFSDRFELAASLPSNSTDPIFSEGMILEFNYSDVPEARYYRVKLIKNFMSIYQDKIDANWNNPKNVNAYSVCELEVWQYNIDE